MGTVGDDGEPVDLFRLASEWLADCDPIEVWCPDWVSAAALPSSLRRGRVLVVGDVDLEAHRSGVPGVFCWLVAERCPGWVRVLGNVLASFTDRAVVVFGSPMEVETNVAVRGRDGLWRIPQVRWEAMVVEAGAGFSVGEVSIGGGAVVSVYRLSR